MVLQSDIKDEKFRFILFVCAQQAQLHPRWRNCHNFDELQDILRVAHAKTFDFETDALGQFIDILLLEILNFFNVYQSEILGAMRHSYLFFTLTRDPRFSS